MKYYLIGTSDDLNIIGHYPQLKFRKSYNPSLPDGYYQLPVHCFPDFLPNLEYELNNKAKDVNILPPYPGRFAFIVDKKVKIILESYNLPPHAFYPTRIFHKGKLLEYYWFHYIPNDFWELIDTRNSYGEIIRIKSINTSVIGNVPIVSKEQILAEKKRYMGLETLVLGKLKMKTDFAKYDFYITGAFNHTIISERLKDELEENMITGYDIRLFDKIIFE